METIDYINGCCMLLKRSRSVLTSDLQWCKYAR